MSGLVDLTDTNMHMNLTKVIDEAMEKDPTHAKESKAAK